jgi:glycosyltransferase involved in cell wall biosynthesis
MNKTSVMHNTSVAFVALHAYPLFNPAVRAIFGGSEVRAWQFATTVASCDGWAVSFVVLDHGQPAAETQDGVQVYAHPYYRCVEPTSRLKPFPLVSDYVERRAGSLFWKVKRQNRDWIRGLSAALFQKMLNALSDNGADLDIDGYAIAGSRIAVYRKIDAAIYCVMGVSEVTLEVAAFCKRHGRKLVILLGSDEDVSEHYRPGSQVPNIGGVPGGMCFAAIQHAAIIVAQTELQRKLLWERFGKTSRLVRNPIRLDSPACNTHAHKHVLWVGKSDSNKRPELFVQLARQFPEVTFVMIMNKSDEAVFREVASSLPSNLRLIERVDFAASDSFYAEAIAFVNTSRFEGFPNTFLQAAKFSVPILSLQVDPDGMLAAGGCGIYAAGNLEALRCGLERLCRNEAERLKMGSAARRYVECNHELQQRTNELAAIFAEAVRAGRVESVN